MNRVEVKGTATLLVRVKHKEDGSIDYTIIEINGEDLSDFLGARLSEGIGHDADNYINVESSARIHFIIEPETLDIKVRKPKEECNSA